jgi:hypothetical protein
MTIPTTGTTWRGAGLANVDSRFNTRGGLAAIGIRMNRGAATDISPWKYDTDGTTIVRGWSPFALDGNPRDDLWAVVRINGEWITNPNPNEGFTLVGALTEDGGAERHYDVKNDNQMILQSTQPFDSDLTEENLAINFTGVETLKPSLKRLRMNLPLQDGNGNYIVEDPGTENFNIGKPVDNEGPEYQIILFFGRRKGGRWLYTAEGYALTKLNNIGSFKRSKTDPDAGQLGYMVLPDPFLVGKDPSNPDSEELVPLLMVDWSSGDGWTAIGGAPVWPGVAPLATQTAATTATVSAANPTGGGDPFEVIVQKSVSPFSTWTSATVGSTTPDTPSSGFTTYNITGLTTATQYKFRLTATGTNGQATTSAVSNPITTT